MKLTYLFTMLATSIAVDEAPRSAPDKEPPRAYHIVVCDTEGQMRRVLELGNPDLFQSIEQVNREEKSEAACLMTDVAYGRVKGTSSVKNKLGLFEVIEVEILGAIGHDGKITYVQKPVHWYSFRRLKGLEI